MTAATLKTDPVNKPVQVPSTPITKLEMPLSKQPTLADDDLVIYFDTIMLAPRSFVSAELIFVLQR